MRLSEVKPMSITINGTTPDNFVKYIRSENALRQELKDKYNSTNVVNIVHLFADYNIAVADNVAITVPVDSLYSFREYDRDPEGPHWVTLDYEKLRQDIKQHGVKDPVILRIKRLTNGDVEAALGEGNHRLRIAKEFNLPLKVRFKYSG